VEQKYYKIEEVCESLRISRATLYRLSKKYGLRLPKIGGQVRFTEAELSRFVQELKEKTA
jgi:excisionase family DNA binding protein